MNYRQNSYPGRQVNLQNNSGNYAAGQPVNQPQAPGNQTSYNYSEMQDYGADPFVVDMEKAVLHNNTYRTALWTGRHLQVTMMEIPVGDDIGLEIHPDTDQFICIVEGSGLVQMGDTQNNLYFNQPAFEGYSIFVPAGVWHDVTNIGNRPLKLYTVYAPPHHPWGTVEQTKADAQANEAAENQYY